jgi:hypothetical protein
MKTCIRIKDGVEFPYTKWDGKNINEVREVFKTTNTGSREVLVISRTNNMLELEVWSDSGKEFFVNAFIGDFIINVEGKPRALMSRFFRDEFFPGGQGDEAFESWLKQYGKETFTEFQSVEEAREVISSTFQRLNSSRRPFEDIEKFLRGDTPVSDMAPAPVEPPFRPVLDHFTDFIEDDEIEGAEYYIIHEGFQPDDLIELQEMVDGINRISGEFCVGRFIDGDGLMLMTLFVEDSLGEVLWECLCGDVLVIHEGEIVSVIPEEDWKN